MLEVWPYVPKNRDGQQFQRLDCSYSVNVDYNAGRTMIVIATKVASDAYVLAERESTDKLTTSAVGR